MAGIELQGAPHAAGHIELCGHQAATGHQAGIAHDLTPHHIRQHPGWQRNKLTLLSMGIAVVLVSLARACVASVLEM